jgi:DNA (cytosine-5)-methyltransferase 1
VHDSIGTGAKLRVPTLIRAGLNMVRGLDLFSGGGGSSWGAALAGVEMVGAVDAWDIATATYKDNFPGAEVLTQRLDIDSGPEIFDSFGGIRKGNVDILIGSPECTHHSVARGAKPRCDESRRSGWYVMRFARELKPRWIVLENVTSMRNWQGYGELIQALEDEGYKLRIQPLDAADFGVPQQRRRLFIMGDRERRPGKILKPANVKVQVAASILDGPEKWMAGPAFTERRAEATKARIQRGIDALEPNTDFLTVYYSSDKGGGWQPLDRPLRTLTTLDRFGLVRWVDGIATLRMLQVPELMRAMGFGVNPRTGRPYVLNQGSRKDKVKILGNGVCPPVMRAIVEHLTIGEVELRTAA